MMKLASYAAALALSVAAFTPVAAEAGKADDTLNIAFAKELEHVDPYYNTAREGVILTYSVWDALLYRDPATGKYVGNLATEWAWTDPTTIEFVLREGVRFHNGEPFDADDVVFTFNHMIDPANGAKNMVAFSWIAGAEKIGPFKVRVRTKGPYPAALEYLAGTTVIEPNEYFAKVGPEGVAVHPVGTGPYRMESVDPGKHFVLKRNEDYFAAAKPKGKIGTIDIRTIPDLNTQMAELFNGTIEMVWQVPSDLAEKMAGRDDFQVVNAPTMRVGYLTLDAAGRSGPDGPLTKPKVRQAIAHAINRQGIVDALMKGSTAIVNSACAPVQFGCATDVPVYDYDPEKAKALLAEAGYPEGFEVGFFAYRDRPLAEAMIGMLAKIGIKGDLRYLQYSALRELRLKGEVPLTFNTWGSNSIYDVSAITSEFFRMGGEDDARDPALAETLARADAEMDREARADLYKAALTTIAEKAYWVPLWNYSTNYVMSGEVAFAPTPDELVRFYEIGWK